MSSGLLPDHIEPLVDRLRSGDHLPIALPDVAAVTEVLMRSLESYFKSIDLTLYKECQDLADYIEDARTEISSLSPEHDDSAGIPRAGQELDAIVEATESATDTIMQAAEDLMSFESDDFEQYKMHVNTEVMKIFEACSFQDITGQRISKVVKTLNHVEDRVSKLISILGITGDHVSKPDVKPILDPEAETINDEDLLNGPALAGEGIDQGEVDSLLNDLPSQPDSSFSATPETSDSLKADEVADEPHGDTNRNEPQSDSEEAADDQAAIENDAPVQKKAETDKKNKDTRKVEAANLDNDDFEETSQADIDSLFA